MCKFIKIQKSKTRDYDKLNFVLEIDHSTFSKSKVITRGVSDYVYELEKSCSILEDLFVIDSFIYRNEYPEKVLLKLKQHFNLKSEEVNLEEVKVNFNRIVLVNPRHDENSPFPYYSTKIRIYGSLTYNKNLNESIIKEYAPTELNKLNLKYLTQDSTSNLFVPKNFTHLNKYHTEGAKYDKEFTKMLNYAQLNNQEKCSQIVLAAADIYFDFYRNAGSNTVLGNNDRQFQILKNSNLYSKQFLDQIRSLIIDIDKMSDNIENANEKNYIQKFNRLENKLKTLIEVVVEKLYVKCNPKNKVEESLYWQIKSILKEVFDSGVLLNKVFTVQDRFGEEYEERLVVITNEEDYLNFLKKYLKPDKIITYEDDYNQYDRILISKFATKDRIPITIFKSIDDYKRYISKQRLQST